MSETDKIHWAENEELLEQFVLGRIGPTESVKLEEHLQVCAQCRRAVLNERELVAGIRLAGRESIKRRLAHRVEQRKPNFSTWYRVAGVAAGIVLLITVGVYNRWFVGTDPQVEKRDRVDRLEKSEEPAPPASPQRQVAEERKSPTEATRQIADAERKEVTSLAAGASRSTGEESAKIGEAQADKHSDFKAGESGKVEGNQEKKGRFAAAASISTVATTWVQGTVISELDQNVPAPAELAANAKDERGNPRKQKSDNAPAGKAANVEARENESQNFVLSQKSLSDLPPSQQNRQQRASQVQTLLQKDPAGTRITVYLDSLLTKKEFELSRVQTIGEDSMILNLGNRLVGYKLPPDWTRQAADRTKKQK